MTREALMRNTPRPNDELRHPVVDQRQQDGRRAQACNQADDERRAVVERPEVVEVAVIQGDLQDQRGQDACHRYARQ